MAYEFSLHALAQIKARNIPIEFVEEVIDNPEQILEEQTVDIHQSVVNFEDGKDYLLRVFLSKKNQTVIRVVITVYKTSQIKKYYQ